MSGDDTTAPAGGPRPDGQALDELLPGALVGDYAVERLVAHGGHGSVYLARHRLLGRRAALKVLKWEFAGSDEMRARFVREARVVNRIHHPEIVDIYDLGTLPDGRPYCVMEILEGQSLGDLIHARAPLAPAEAVELLAPVCRALEAAHQAGVVHRDVKASNVMVLAGEGPPRVKLLDFGIAKASEPGEAGLTTAGQRLGTVVAMAPEQLLGQPVDLRADIYALGVLLYQMLTGRPPFSAPDPVEVEHMHLEVPAPRPSELAPVPPGIDAVVARALEKSPERRWPSASAMLEAARAALAPASSPPAQLQPAVTVRVSLRLPAEPDDATLMAQADAAEIAEAALRQGGYHLAVATAGALLGVRPLPGDPAEDRRLRAAAVELARGLEAALERPGLAVSLAVAVAEAEVRDGPGGPEVVGGPACVLADSPPDGERGVRIGPGVLG
jgi:eukaryotic-like serine/threonine-protein kinase